MSAGVAGLGGARARRRTYSWNTTSRRSVRSMAFRFEPAVPIKRRKPPTWAAPCCSQGRYCWEHCQRDGARRRRHRIRRDHRDGEVPTQHHGSRATVAASTCPMRPLTTRIDLVPDGRGTDAAKAQPSLRVACWRVACSDRRGDIGIGDGKFSGAGRRRRLQDGLETV
jgi:hypothetical protein